MNIVINSPYMFHIVGSHSPNIVKAGFVGMFCENMPVKAVLSCKTMVTESTDMIHHVSLPVCFVSVRSTDMKVGRKQDYGNNVYS